MMSEGYLQMSVDIWVMEEEGDMQDHQQQNSPLPQRYRTHPPLVPNRYISLLRCIDAGTVEAADDLVILVGSADPVSLLLSDRKERPEAVQTNPTARRLSQFGV